MEFPDVLAERAEANVDESLRLLSLKNLDQVQRILSEYERIDVPRDHIELFRAALLYRADSWFVETLDEDGDSIGLIYLTDIVPEFSAKFNMIFWDKKLSVTRRHLAQKVIATAFEEFNLVRLSAMAPASNRPLHEANLPKIGFKQEGLLRKAWRGKVDEDLYLFGLLRDEAKAWEPQVHLQMTSSVART